MGYFEDTSVSVLLIWAELAVCAVLIGVAGPALSKNADIIADKTDFSASWIGLILLGTITSLPELVTGLTAVTGAEVPDIAVGDVLGSCVFNLLILVLVDLLLRRSGVGLYQLADQGHILSAGFGIVLVGVVALSLLLASSGFAPAIGHVGFYTPLIVGLYLIGVRAVFVYERRHREAFVEGAEERYPGITLKSASIRLGLASAVIVAAGIWLPFIASRLANAMEWETSFVGSLFVAGATSLPELVVTIAAVRIGAYNLAIANLLGSNLFDILILAVDDIAYLPGPILSHVSPAHAISASSAGVMTGLVVISLLFRPAKRLFSAISWTSLALLAFYILNGFAVFRFDGR